MRAAKVGGRPLRCQPFGYDTTEAVLSRQRPVFCNGMARCVSLAGGQIFRGMRAAFSGGTRGGGIFPPPLIGEDLGRGQFGGGQGDQIFQFGFDLGKVGGGHRIGGVVGDRAAPFVDDGQSLRRAVRNRGMDAAK